MKRKSIHLLLFAIFIGMLLTACTPPDAPKPTPDPFSTDGDTTESDIREQKPKFLDFTAATQHLANSGEDNHIRIVSHSDDLQKVWMVYYDHKNKKWETLTWVGKGVDKIIADTVFNTIYGIVEHPGPIDYPAFFMAYSKDDGKTWQNHPIEKAQLNCKGNEAQLLVSDDFDHKTAKPAIVAILQCSQSGFKTSKSLEDWVNSYLCSMMSNVKSK